ncbi:uncharacterized protein CDAR_549972 [Caerostris darwini]|uniref:Pseudouridine synthase RsuA/RluA-like domain-containing protein n=1 Tax=Caerostris darwini TaxID=1538125 RepID=A0AAV4QGX7_9ARAC|nr:uncharacterized protein CDAR_549972 [Caerostris darwini]
MKLRLLSGAFHELYYIQNRFINLNPQETNQSQLNFHSKNIHCYKTLFPFNNISELAEHLVSSVVYNKGGLIAVNKPFGLKIHSHDKPGTRSKNGQSPVVSSIPDCNLTFEDTLGELKERLKISNLSILKSAERYINHM